MSDMKATSYTAEAYESMRRAYIEKCFELARVKERLDHLISNGVTVQKWIPVSERLPEDGVRVLACGECMVEPIAIAWYYNDFEVWRTDEYTYSPKEVAFWMPLPEPPKECE